MGVCFRLCYRPTSSKGGLRVFIPPNPCGGIRKAQCRGGCWGALPYLDLFVLLAAVSPLCFKPGLSCSLLSSDSPCAKSIIKAGQLCIILMFHLAWSRPASPQEGRELRI